MTELRVFAVVVALAFHAGCARVGSAPGALGLPVRVLSSEAAPAPRPLPTTESAGSATKAAEPRSPRIGAPGGSGAGSRRVVPAQSGNETVGGLPVGMGGSTGPVGRG